MSPATLTPRRAAVFLLLLAAPQACMRATNDSAADTSAALRAASATPKTSVRGEAFIESFEPLPADAIVRVELRDAARPESVSSVIATQEFTAAQGPPWSFELLAPDSLVTAGARLVLSARINSGDRLLFASGEDTPVQAGTAAGPLRLQLSAVTMSDGTGAGTGRQQVTPVPTLRVQCGTYEFRLALEAGAAYVTAADGSVLTLPRLTTPGGEDPRVPRTFTNGRWTFTQEVDGAKRVSFARGKMAPTPCTTM
ncbi:MAG: YbaY family lipoprotein [Gemmatimonadota bacterium]